jgi:hypothetical protein
VVVPRAEIARHVLEVLLATAAALLSYWYTRRHPALVATVGSRFDAYATRHSALFIGATALLPLLLRLAVLPWVPPPVPWIHDEFGHLLVADTLMHGRLANPPHPLAPHLETIYVLQSPTYASKYPIGQGLILAVGTIATGVPWAGVLLAAALMCGAISWMLFGHAPAGWAAIGGVLAAIVLSPTHGWIDTFWGGAFSAFGGALLFGALLRLWKGPSPLLGLTAGFGWGIVWLTRPYESLVPLVFTWAIVLARALQERRRWRAWGGTLALLGLAQLGVGGLTALHNRAVTGSFTMLPYVLSQRTYGVPQSLLGQPPIEAPAFKTPEQAAEYRSQRRAKEAADSRPLRHAGAIAASVWAFFVKSWLSVPVIAGLIMLRDPVVLGCVTLLAAALLTSSLYGFFLAHYWGAYAGVFILLALRGLMRFEQWQPSGRPIGRAAAAFFLVGTLATILSAVPIGPILGISDYGYVAPLRHRVADRLSAIEGQHVVFVKYGQTHNYRDEWVYNDAAIDASRIVWCRAISPEDDARVLRYYQGRQFWLAEVESGMVRVTRLHPEGNSQSSGVSSPGPEEWVLTTGSEAHR